jgi:transmembrane sensor
METSVESSARPTLRRWTLAGAGAVLAATAAIAAVIILSPRLSEVSPVVEEIYRTRVGEKATIDLADGSTIIENTDSLLSVEYSEIARFVTLSHGEAFFEVEPDPARAFSVNAGSTTITAVGTAFSVFREGATVEVLVSEGVVEVSQADRSDIAENGAALADSPLLVRSGELAEVGPTQARVESIDTDEIARRLFWRQGLLAFEGEPLEQVIEEFSRYTNVEIRIASEEIRDIRVGGYFDSGDLAGMLTALQNNFGIEVTSTGQDQVLLSRAEQ